MPLFPQTPRQHPGFIAGRTYSLTFGAAVSNAAVAAIDTIYLYPFILGAPITFTGGIVRVTTGGAGSSCKGAIWANSPVSMRPLGAPLYTDNTGVVTTSSTTNAAVALGAGSLSAGVMYWFGTKFTGTLPSMLAIQATPDVGPFNYMTGSTGLNITCISYADTYSNAMPTIAEGSGTLTAATTNCPILGLAT